MCDLKEHNFQQGNGVKVRFNGGWKASGWSLRTRVFFSFKILRFEFDSFIDYISCAWNPLGIFTGNAFFKPHRARLVENWYTKLYFHYLKYSVGTNILVLSGEFLTWGLSWFVKSQVCSGPLLGATLAAPGKSRDVHYVLHEKNWVL